MQVFASLLGFLSLLAVLCSCIGSAEAAACTKPAVRKEWRALSSEQRADWIRAVNCLSHVPHNPALTPSVDPSVSQIPPVNSSGSYLDDIVYVHMDLNTRIHFTGLFLPWHRWFVQAYETALKDQCGYTGASPYWNWTQDAADFFGSTLFQDPDPASGLGGWGDLARDFAVPDGGFSNLHLSYPAPHTLRRNFTLQPFLGLDKPAGMAPFFPDPAKQANSSFTAPEVEKMVGGFVGDFVGFQQYFEQYEGAHSSIHTIMGGDLGGTCPINAPQNCTPGPTWSVNEPLFFLHHAMVDKVWDDWQHRNVANFWQFHGGTVEEIANFTSYTQYPNGAPPFLNFFSKIPADGMFPEVSIADVMDTTGGYLCYVYE